MLIRPPWDNGPRISDNWDRKGWAIWWAVLIAVAVLTALEWLRVV